MRYSVHQSKRSSIQALKPYLYGILKNHPSLEDLYTPQEQLQAKQLKQQEIDEKQSELANQKKQEQALAVEKMKVQVESYLDSCTSQKRKELEQAFNNSVFSTGLKFGSEKVDLNKKIVRATFYYFVHKKFLS